jgi:hypothetical protein
MRAVITLGVVLILGTPTPAHAYPPCGPYDNPNETHWFCRPYFEVSNERVYVTDLAYVRNVPSNSGIIIATLPKGTFLGLAGFDQVWDGAEWWWNVQTNEGTNGWLEQQFLESAAPPIACYIQLPKIYLIIDGQRRHVVDWDTFLALGYNEYSYDACGDAANYPEGAPITRLLKGSGEEIYYMENGVRHHIVDMDVFTAHGFKIADISVIPDRVLGYWPIGEPLK